MKFDSDPNSAARAWGVTVEDTFETATARIAFGRRGMDHVVIKLIKQPGDEWRSGAVLDAFEGRGTARVYDHTGGALLLERLQPGTPLRDLVLADRDDEATGILAGVIASMSPRRPPDGCPTVEKWGDGFDRYAATGDARIPPDLVSHARVMYAELCASQTSPRLLHGDLQHSNVLYDRERGWLAIDPKGVIGEVEFETGAMLRNPVERPDLFTRPATIEVRVRALGSRLGFDPGRVLAWAFSQAVLSAIWEVEDGVFAGATNPSILLAERIRPMLQGTG